jgi:hypothetical protein
MSFKETNMKSNRWVGRAAGAGALTLILAMPAVAQTRGDWQRNDGSNQGSAQTSSRNDRGNNRVQDNNRDNNSGRQPASPRSSRENERVTMQGRVSSFTHENGGYRVQLDRDSRSFRVPESYVRSRGHNFGIGVSMSLGGVFRGGQIYVDAVNWPGDGGYGYGSAYDRGYIRGVVDRVDNRSGVMWVRDDASGRLIEADMRDAGRYSRIDARDLRRGDFVELSGQWLRGNIFAVDQVDSVRTGRY